MKNFAIVTNLTKDPCRSYFNGIKNIIESCGCNCTASIFISSDSENIYGKADSDSIPEDTELIISLGGDGSFLHTAKDLIDRNIPIVGVNLGNLGYLTEIDADGFKTAFTHIVEGEYRIEKRMVLKGSIIRSGKEIVSDIAINDIVLNRIGSMNIMDFDIMVNGSFLNSYSADGYIISSPTGSTGYNLSAGGPVAHPEAGIIITTPICAHSLNSRSVVFSSDSTIEVLIKGRGSEGRSVKALSFDGGREIILNNDDLIRVEKSEKVLNNLRLNKLSFVEHLGKKMR